MNWKKFAIALIVVAIGGYSAGLLRQAFGVEPDNSLFGWLRDGILFFTAAIFGAIIFSSSAKQQKRVQ